MSVPRETEDRLAAFVALLLTWNRTISLVSQRDEPDIRVRHVEDSLRLLPLITPGTSDIIDLGSGGGFPGLVIAIAAGIHVHLIEADKRKAAFLAEAARLTKAPVTVHAARIETCPCAPAPLITSRALAPLSTLLDLAYPLMTDDAVCLFPKGKSAETEIVDAGKLWSMRIDRYRGADDPSSVILRISEVSRVQCHEAAEKDAGNRQSERRRR